MSKTTPYSFLNEINTLKEELSGIKSDMIILRDLLYKLTEVVLRETEEINTPEDKVWSFTEQYLNIKPENLL